MTSNHSSNSLNTLNTKYCHDEEQPNMPSMLSSTCAVNW